MFFKLKLAVALAVAYVLLSPPAEAGTAGAAGAAGAAEGSQLRRLVTLDDSRGWEGVGRLDMGTRSFCTGALVAENLVLTAGHCLYDRDSGARIPTDEIRFLAGWRSGRASAYRGVRRAIVHPDYAFSSQDVQGRVRYDLALLELDQPIRSSSIRPFAIHRQPARGAEVGVVSYAFDRADSPSLQESCKILARQAGTLVMSCEVDYGSSGAPVFVIEDGQAQIVSVVSAKAMARDMPVSLGTSLEQPLAEMMALLAADAGRFERAEPIVQVLAPTGREGTGAKFLRP